MGEVRRRRLRLRHYDYASAGWYFVTVCTAARACRFGDVIDGVMQPNDVGREIAAQWTALPRRFPRVTLDAFVVMPNHLHGLLGLRAGDATNATSLGDVVGAFKSTSAVAYGRGVRDHGWDAYRGQLWQRNYFEHVVRDERGLAMIRQYIVENPLRWHLDRENPDAVVAGDDSPTWDASIDDE